MDTYKLKFTRLQNEIFRFLCVNAGTAVNQREIAKALRVSPTAVSNALDLLEKEKLIVHSVSQKMNLAFIEINRENARAVAFKRVENLKMIYESGIVQFLQDELPGTTIILFGSYSNGSDVMRSDIDLAVIDHSNKTLPLGKFESFLGREISINFYKSWKDIHRDLRNNILNGVVLTGTIDL